MGEDGVLHDGISGRWSRMTEHVAVDDFGLHTCSTSVEFYVSESLHLGSMELWSVVVCCRHMVLGFLSEVYEPGMLDCVAESHAAGL